MKQSAKEVMDLEQFVAREKGLFETHEDKWPVNWSPYKQPSREVIDRITNEEEQFRAKQEAMGEPSQQDQRGGVRDKGLDGSFERKNRKLLMTNYKMYLRNQPPISVGNKKLQLSYEDFVKKEELDYRIYERLKDKILETGKHLLVQQHTSDSYLNQNKMIPLCWYLKSETSSTLGAQGGRKGEEGK